MSESPKGSAGGSEELDFGGGVLPPCISSLLVELVDSWRREKAGARDRRLDENGSRQAAHWVRRKDIMKACGGDCWDKTIDL